MKGVYSIVSAVLAMAAFAALAMLAMPVAKNQVGKAQALNEFSRGAEELEKIARAVERLRMSEPGSKIAMKVSLGRGSIASSPENSSLYYELETPFDIFPPGFFSKQGMLEISSGKGVRAYDNGTFLVLDNGVMRAYFRKGNVSSSEFLYKVERPGKGIEFYPGLNFGVWGIGGTGHGSLTKKGLFPQASVVFESRNISQPYNFTAIFTLRAGLDSLELKIRNVRKN